MVARARSRWSRRAPALAPLALAAALACAAGAPPAPSRHVAVSFDASRSMAPAHVSSAAHARTRRYLRALLLEGWSDGALLPGDRVGRGPLEDLPAPLLRPGDSWAAYRFGDRVETIAGVTTARLDPARLDRLYPEHFGDRSTRLAPMEAVLLGTLASMGSDEELYWVSVSDELVEDSLTPGAAPSPPLPRPPSWETLFVLEVTGGGIYAGRPAIAYLRVQRIRRPPAASRLAADDLVCSADTLLERRDPRLRDLDVAYAAYRRALALVPEHAGAHAGLARLLLLTRELPEALEVASEGLALAPDLVALRLTLAEVLRDMGEIDRALAAIPDGWLGAAAPADAARGYFLLGTIQARRSPSPAQALRSFERALALDPDLHEAYYLRAYHRFVLGRDAEARSDLELLLVRWPEGPDAPRARRLLGAIPRGRRPPAHDP